MNEQTNILFEKLAEKLGTTVEHLWGVLLTQAPISGFIDLVTCIALVFAMVFVYRLVRRKTTVPQKTEENKYPSAEWVDDGRADAWICTTIFILIGTIIVAASLEGILAAFFNPEYWALKRVLLIM